MSERRGLIRRLGFHNLYDEVCAVNYYELDLANPQMRCEQFACVMVMSVLMMIVMVFTVRLVFAKRCSCVNPMQVGYGPNYAFGDIRTRRKHGGRNVSVLRRTCRRAFTCVQRRVNIRYNDINFELPNGWTNETPQKGNRVICYEDLRSHHVAVGCITAFAGIYTTYYCRELKTIEKLRAQ